MIICKHITPDSPEFAAIAATITPINRVRKESHPRTYIDAETVSWRPGRRREDIDKLQATKKPCSKCKCTHFKPFGDGYTSCVNCGTLRDHQPQLVTMQCEKGADPARSHYVGKAIAEVSYLIRKMVEDNFEQIAQWRAIGRSWKFIANKMPGGYGRAALDRHFTELKAEGFGK